MTSEKSTDEAGSRYNKGTIRGDLGYLGIKRCPPTPFDINQLHQPVAVTAEVASSSLVVPAIPFQQLIGSAPFSRGHKKAQNRYT
jgi:hypothetical protein